MKIHETKVVPEKVISQIVGLKCDLCKKESHDGDNWSEETWTFSEVTIQIKTGSSYPSDNYGTEQEIDLCPDCFNNRLIVWLKSQGAEISDPVDWST